VAVAGETPAPKLFDEGIDLPEADPGIILVASRSRLLMIQRLGRVVCRQVDGRMARLVIFYVAGATEDPHQVVHETFLHAILPVAADTRYFKTAEPTQRITEYLNDYRSRQISAPAQC
jgi:hypothetical protein